MIDNGGVRMINNFRTEKLYILKITSFLTSMFPLSLYLLLKYINEDEKVFKYIQINIFFISLFIIEIISIFYILYFFKRKIIKSSNLNRKSYKIKNITQEKTSTSNYLLSNVLPVVSLNTDNVSNIIFFVVLLLLLSFMYIKNDLYYINPLYDIINIKSYKGDVYLNNERENEIKFIISSIPLYEFNTREYTGIKFKNILIISKRTVNN